ncbi:Glucoside xylosyltransferase 2 [Armadillidium nasatum]|uniref:Glucoside xylosyltransferase 2 n=1 Tax=Armadillidium nasatum TaxID=96803 RepID=A0A5N5TAX1_9CRUS|nr:Glucoside xylosyltransferase 2 [Armadillidium nasatum]
MLSRWPENIRNKILLEKEKIVYPENGNFREKFRLCASERLFLSEALPSEEAVIFLDTDIIFLKSPEILWEEFAFFNSEQLSGLSPSLYLYHRFYKFPVYGKSGLNAGVWMMNLTRIRSIPRGWTTAILKIASVYEGKLKLFDQDIANILFSKALFKAFLKFDVENPLEELLQSIKTSLKNIDYEIDTSRCSKLANIDEMLTKSLEKTILTRI